MQVKASEIKVDRADDRRLVVRNEVFRVNESGGIFVDFHAVFYELTVVRAGHGENEPLVRNVRSDDADVNSAFCGENERRLHFVVDYEVGRGDVHIVLGAVDYIEVDVFADRFVVKRGIGERHHKAFSAAVRDFLRSGHVLAVFVGLAVGKEVPHCKEHHREAPDALALEHNGAVLPVAVLFVFVDIFVGEVNAAGERSMTVDDKNFTVIAVVHFRRPYRPELIEYPALYALFLKNFVILVGEGKQAADIVVYHADVNALFHLPFEDIEDSSPHFALGDDKIFEEYKALSLFQLLYHCGEFRLADRKVGSFGVCVDRIASVVVEVLRLLFSGGVVPVESAHKLVVLREQQPGFIVVLRHSFSQTVAGVAVAKENVEHHAENRE